MAFAYVVKDVTVFGNKRIVEGTYDCSSGSVTGGDIVTGLNRVDQFFIQEKGSSVATNRSVVNATLPLASGTVTIVTDASQLGTWLAIGV